MVCIHFAWFTFHFFMVWLYKVFQGNGPVPGLHLLVRNKVVYFEISVISSNKKRVTEDMERGGD